MSEEISKKIKFYKKAAAIEFTPPGMIELAHSLDQSKKTYDWTNKQMTGFSADEMLQIIDVIDKVDPVKVTKDNTEAFNKRAEQAYKAGGLKIELQHLKAKVPKYVILKPQIYNGAKQLNIAITLSDAAKFPKLKNIQYSLDWHQVKGFKIFLEECFRRNLFAAFEEMKEGDFILSKFAMPDKTKKEMYLKRILPAGTVVFDKYVIDKAKYDSENDIMGYLLIAK